MMNRNKKFMYMEHIIAEWGDHGYTLYVHKLYDTTIVKYIIYHPLSSSSSTIKCAS